MLHAYGPVFVRRQVYGLLLNVVQAICQGSTETSSVVCRDYLTVLSNEETVKLFGCSSNDLATADTGYSDPDQLSMSHIAAATEVFHEVINKAAPNTGRLLLSVNDSSAKLMRSDTANAWRARWMSLIAGTAFQYNQYLQPRAFAILGVLAQKDVVWHCIPITEMNSSLA